MSRDIVNVKTVRDKKYNTLNLGTYNELLGKVESKFIMTLYGHSGSGKSVFALRFADYCAKHVGKVLYNSHEEMLNQTIQDRINKWDIDAERLYFGKALSFERMMEAIRKNYYRIVVIDSVKYMRFTAKQLEELQVTFAKRKLSIVMVNFGNTLGRPAGSQGVDLLHASDVKCFFKGGHLNITSRYLAEPVDQFLFGKKATIDTQLKLF